MDNVVRALASRSLESASGEIELALPADLVPANTAVIVYVQAEKGHRVLGATGSDLPPAAPAP